MIGFQYVEQKKESKKEKNNHMAFEHKFHLIFYELMIKPSTFLKVGKEIQLYY